MALLHTQDCYIGPRYRILKGAFCLQVGRRAGFKEREGEEETVQEGRGEVMATPASVNW